VTDFMEHLEHDLVDAARRLEAAGARSSAPASTRRRARWRDSSTRTLALAAALFTVAAGGAAAGTLTVLRGSPIPAPAAADVPTEQTPQPGTSRVSEIRLADPGADVPPWTVRVARSETGLVCTTVGQVADGDFGLVGMDGRFRVLPERAVDACGELQEGALTLIGARVLDAEDPGDVRTVVSGVAHEGMEDVTVAAAGAPVPARHDDGVFAAVVPGLPEDSGIRATVVLEGGESETHTFGIAEDVVPDPAGGRAWRLVASQIGGAPGEDQAQPPSCVSFEPARRVINPVVSEWVCGVLGDPRAERGVFFTVRRLEADGRELKEEGWERLWRDHPPRTAVWGAAGDDVAKVELRGPDGLWELPLIRDRLFLAVLRPEVEPEALRVRVTFEDGRVEVHRGDTNLVAAAGPGERP
jgi:hypothetical protein